MSRSRTRFSSSVLLLLLLAGASSVVACGGNDGPAPLPLANDLAARLEADTGVAWALLAEPGAPSPRLLGPTTPVALPGATHEEQARGFFARYGEALGTHGAPAFVPLTDSDEPDGAHETAFTEVVPGTTFPVFDAISSVRFGQDGKVLYVQSALAHDLSALPRSPKLTEPDAARKAAEHVLASCGESPTVTPKISLGALPGDAPHLAYRVELEEAVGTCSGPTVYVDATGGAVLEMRVGNIGLIDRSRGGSSYYWNDASDIKSFEVTPSGSGYYDLRTSSAPVVSTQYLGPDGRKYPVRLGNLGAWDAIDKGVTVDGAYFASKALEYFRTAHGWSGVDGKGSPLTVVMHDNTALNSNGDNALYDVQTREVHIGDGTPTGQFLPLSLAYDVLVHEVAHGVIAETSRLVYEGQSGALNESFADVMGVSAAHWLPELRNTADMRVGRRVTKSGEGLRDMLSPRTFGQPEVMTAPIPCTSPHPIANDNCGVHFFSGIPNRAFSLMTLGGGIGRVQVPKGIGFEASRYIWFRAMTSLRQPRSTFRDAAYVQVFEAGLLGRETLTSVGCAWMGVGVLTPTDFGPWGGIACGDRTRLQGCSQVVNGYVCHETVSNAAYVCRNGAIASGILCKNLSHACIPRSRDDREATLTAAGDLACRPVQ